jgi:hypothetical protein
MKGRLIKLYVIIIMGNRHPGQKPSRPKMTRRTNVALPLNKSSPVKVKYFRLILYYDNGENVMYKHFL